MQNRLQAYQQSHILTAAPGDILLALLDGAMRFVAVAKDAIARGDFQGKAQAINRASAILGELTSTLDKRHHPQLCAQLASLYGYFLERLGKAGINMQTAPAEEVLQHLTRLRATWQQAVSQARAEGLRV